jgi:hypothetical protein
VPRNRGSEDPARERVDQLPDVLRALFVIADTDRSEHSTAILELHRRLARLGVQMRTVALGPGRRGGLDSMVPVLSPAARSLAAVTQLRREQRWADVVVCWGITTSVVQQLGGSRRRAPTVIGCGAEAEDQGILASIAYRGAVRGPACYDPTIWRGLLCQVSERSVGRS